MNKISPPSWSDFRTTTFEALRAPLSFDFWMNAPSSDFGWRLACIQAQAPLTPIPHLQQRGFAITEISQIAKMARRGRGGWPRATARGPSAPKADSSMLSALQDSWIFFFAVTSALMSSRHQAIATITNLLTSKFFSSYKLTSCANATRTPSVHWDHTLNAWETYFICLEPSGSIWNNLGTSAYTRCCLVVLSSQSKWSVIYLLKD